MLKSISIWAFDNARPMAEVFKEAKDAGFAGVEAAIGSGGLTLDSTAEDCAGFVQQAKDAGITLASLASGGGWASPITSTDPTVRQRGLDEVAKSLHIAKWLGLDTILLVPGGVGADFIDGFQVVPYDVAYENALTGINELKAVAEETGVNIGVENVWNKFLLSPLEMRDFIDKTGSANVGAYFDTGNVLLTGFPEQWISILGKRIKRVHFKDFKNSVGTIDGFCDLLEGDVNYPAVMQGLRDIGYDGPVTAEFFGVDNAGLRKISAAMDKILAM